MKNTKHSGPIDLITLYNTIRSTTPGNGDKWTEEILVNISELFWSSFRGFLEPLWNGFAAIIIAAIICKLQAQAGQPIPGHRVVLVVGRLALVALWKPWNNCYKKFGFIHVDVKNVEEAESDLIFSIKSAKSGQKIRFVKAHLNFEKLACPGKTTFLTVLG